MDNIINVSKAKFWTENDGIVYCIINNNDIHHKLNSKHILGYREAVVKLCDGNPKPLLIDLRNVIGSLNSEAFKSFANQVNLKKLIIKGAYVINSIAMHLTVLTFKRIFNPSIPFKIFRSDIEAKQYCIDSKHKHYAQN